MNQQSEALSRPKRGWGALVLVVQRKSQPFSHEGRKPTGHQLGPVHPGFEVPFSCRKMARELISPEGLRIDGRRPNEIRRLKCEMGLFERADGSAYFEQGNTRVLCAVYGPREVELRSTARQDRAIVNCEYSMATFSTGERKLKRKGDRRSTEISLIIKQTFEAAIFTHLYPNSQIDIYIQVIQADGGTRCAGINAATLALIDAGIAMSDFVVACAAGYIDETPLLDLNHYEDSGGSADLPVAIFPKSDKVIMAQMDCKVPLNTFEKVLRTAMDGCHRIYEVLVECVRERSLALLESNASSS
jgi:exosome complex component RRP41